jgi:hypothetical protein
MRKQGGGIWVTGKARTFVVASVPPRGAFVSGAAVLLEILLEILQINLTSRPLPNHLLPVQPRELAV